MEKSWALGRLDQFHADGLRLSDPDAARMLVAIGEIGVRDALWEDMSTETAPSHAAVWADLVRRAPDEVRTPAAGLLGLASTRGCSSTRSASRTPAVRRPQCRRCSRSSASQP